MSSSKRGLNVDTPLHRGVALANAGDQAGAIAAFREAVRLAPNDHQAWRNLGAALKGMASPAERIVCYRRALAIADDPYTHANLAAALLEAGECQAGVEAARAALAVCPEYLPAWINLGHGLAFLGQLTEAESTYRRALVFAPEDADLLHGLGTLLAAMQRYEDAAEMMKRAEAIRPDDHKIGAVAARARQQVADWSRFERDVANLVLWIKEHREGLPPFNLLSLPGISPLAQRVNATVHAAAEFGSFFQTERPVRARRADGRLRVGYLSADLRAHVIGRLLGPVLQQSVGRAHEVYVYDLWPGENPLKVSLLPHVAAWCPVAQLGVQAIAKLIAADGIDVLVDLGGYTAHGRSAVLACRPAPVQVSFLGYPGSLGDQRLVDYILSDRVTSPVEHAEHYVEALAWMPGCVLPPLAFEADLPNVKRTDLGLPEAGPVLAAFHNGYKYNPMIFAYWMRILNALPEAVLWLLTPSELMRKRLRSAARTAGGDAERLHFYAGGSYAEYLAALGLADLFLDAQPYGAGGTARDALWAGLPVVTVLGDRFAGRMAASACLEAGLADCCASSLDEYVDMAIELVRNVERRRTLSQRLLAARAEGVTRLAGYAEALDGLYQRMAERARAGLAPVALMAANSLAVKFEAKLDDQKQECLVRTFLHVGCGPKRKDQTTQGFNRDDWRELRLDIDPAVKPDVVGTMLDMSAVGNASVAAIFSSHNIEHLYPHEVPVVLAEFRRVLVPDGFVVITCPDLQSVCALVAEDKLTEAAYQSPAGLITPLDILYGHRPALAVGNHYMAHRCGFTERVLVGTLRASGFVSVASRRRSAPFFDLWVVATLVQMDEAGLRELALAHFPG